MFLHNYVLVILLLLTLQFLLLLLFLVYHLQQNIYLLK
nr:MAG TPA: hypothetical protein [Bacteriophage sp.]